MQVRDLIARRSDLSTFLVHLCRSTSERSAKDALKRILEEQTIRAMSVFGHAKSALEWYRLNPESQRCVCFTEAPLEQLYLLTSEIENRSFQFEPYGIAITKRQGRNRGVNPVWYVDITPGHDWLTEPLDRLRDRSLGRDGFTDPDVEALLPFIEQMGTGERADGTGPYRKEFWWEREWRHRGNLILPLSFLVLCPENEIAEFQDLVRNGIRFIDPKWSLEQIIARLAMFPESDVELR